MERQLQTMGTDVARQSKDSRQLAGTPKGHRG